MAVGEGIWAASGCVLRRKTDISGAHSTDKEACRGAEQLGDQLSDIAPQQSSRPLEEGQEWGARGHGRVRDGGAP